MPPPARLPALLGRLLQRRHRPDRAVQRHDPIHGELAAGDVVEQVGGVGIDRTAGAERIILQMDYLDE